MTAASDCRLAADTFDPATELATFSERAEGAGAIASFTGVARPADRQGNTVSSLTLDHHERLTLASLEDIAAQADARFDISAILVIHRHGRVAAGDPIVFVAAASAHRRAAFLAVDYAMDRLKTDAVFWKREDGPSGSKWIEPTAQDHVDRGRWDAMDN